MMLIESKPRSCGVWSLALGVLLLCVWPRAAAQTGAKQGFASDSLPPLPATIENAFVGVDQAADALISASPEHTYVLPAGAEQWREAEVAIERQAGAALSTPDGLLCIGGTTATEASAAVTRLRWDAETDTLNAESLGALPRPLDNIVAVLFERQVYVTDGRWLGRTDPAADTLDWLPHPLPVERIGDAVMVEQQGRLLLFGRVDGASRAFAGRLSEGDLVWEPIADPPTWLDRPVVAAFGLAHVMFFGTPADDPGTTDVLVYHTITDTWINPPAPPALAGQLAAVTAWRGDAVVLGSEASARVRPAQLPTNYGWFDNLVVAAYLLGMIGIGWYFTKRENSSNDFFRGGQRIPWWAAGMSLFATGASAISLAGMPGMGFGTDWTYFTISICSALCLPIGIFIMAPLVRRLQIKTANEYLERRFGVTSRLFASVIFMFTQIAARIASVMLLSAIALEAITDMNIMTAIIIMGVVTTVYTYLGGLEAVIWTDTVQGFVMVGTVVGCLLLALLRLDQPPGELWAQVTEYDKNHMFDWSTSIVGPTTFIFFVHTLFLTFGGISDQNFVQRVQSTPDLKQTKLAVATQMAVAVPINVLLFSLGTVLWLFYRSRPEELSPTIVNNDGVFPFFAAQQLPIGVSGIVVAALLAATMSTVSSSICAVSDLGTNDFYRRFKKNATDHQCLVLGRILTGVVGLAGTLAAIVLAGIDDVKSVWDLAIMVTGLISSSVLGLFMLGLLTRRAHEVGALIGAAAGMSVIVWLKNTSPITFWLYIVIGPLVTIFVGYTASLVIPGRARQTRGLTLYSMRHAGPLPPPVGIAEDSDNPSTE